MVQLIVGEKGKGKTKVLLDKVNSQVQIVDGNILYLDKSSKHMYELNNKIRLIDISEYEITDSNEFIGFILGLISQDHDIEQIYLDSFLKTAAIKENLSQVINKLEAISIKFNIGFTLSVSQNEVDLPKEIAGFIEVSL